jgi:hypothetical protein
MISVGCYVSHADEEQWGEVVAIVNNRATVRWGVHDHHTLGDIVHVESLVLRATPVQAQEIRELSLAKLRAV